MKGWTSNSRLQSSVKAPQPPVTLITLIVRRRPSSAKQAHLTLSADLPKHCPPAPPFRSPPLPPVPASFSLPLPHHGVLDDLAGEEGECAHADRRDLRTDKAHVRRGVRCGWRGSWEGESTLLVNILFGLVFGWSSTWSSTGLRLAIGAPRPYRTPAIRYMHTYWCTHVMRPHAPVWVDPTCGPMRLSGSTRHAAPCA